MTTGGGLAVAPVLGFNFPKKANSTSEPKTAAPETMVHNTLLVVPTVETKRN